MTNLGGTGVSENTDFDDEITELFDRQDRLNPLTLAAWQADTSAKAGDVVTPQERVAGEGGGAPGLVIAGILTVNGDNRVQHGTLSLTWVLNDYLSSLEAHSADKVKALSLSKMSSGEGGTITTTTETDILNYVELNQSRIESTTNQFAFHFIAKSDMFGANLDNASGVTVDYSANATKTKLIGSRLESSGAVDAHTVNINELGIVDALIAFNIFDAGGYAILTNDSGSIDGLVVVGNILNAGSGDAVEINMAAGADHKNIPIVGNVLRTTGTGGSNAGFGVGIAEGKNTAVVGNVCDAPRSEAYHVEGDIETLCLVGNVATECAEEGVFHINTPAGGAGFPLVGNSLQAKAANTSAGILHGFTVDGSPPLMSAVCNKVKGFDTGLELGKETSIFDDNTVDSCNRAILAAGGGDSYGRTLAKDTPILIKATAGAVLDTIITDTIPTTFLDITALSTIEIGLAVKEMHFPIADQATVNTADTTINLIALPKIMHGRVIVRAKSVGADFLYASGTINWDGTTLIATEIIRDKSGVFGSTVNFIDNAGQLALTIFTSSIVTISTKVSIIGEFYDSNTV